MKKNYIAVFSFLFLANLLPAFVSAQDCSTLTATFRTYESRCAATGSIKVTASGGSGSYKYKVNGPVSTNFTSTDSITGLSTGAYTVTVNDIISNCTYTASNVVVTGQYKDPRFTLNAIDVSCDNGNNGGINVLTQNFGRSPFSYSIIAPSPMGIGTVSPAGSFSNLIAGDYTIRLTDSCGGIQTRLVTINNYTWWIDSYSFAKTSCDTAAGFIKVIDSKGNISTVGIGIPGLTYGIVRQAGDTIWSSNPNFTFNLLGNTIDIVVKDACGKIKKGNTTLNFSAQVGASVNIYNATCNAFSVTLTGVSNFFGPNFCLFDSSGAQIVCNTTGVFTNLPFGKYCIKAHDMCTDTTITRCFTGTPPALSVNNNIAVSNKNCTSFSATVTGQVGLTNPTYCLYDSMDVQLSCNSTSTFDNLLYGNYCITIKDGCRDTTIRRCFSAQKPRPVVPAVINPGYTTCTNFGIVVGGDSLFFPRFCLYDSSGALLMCNNTGVFDSLAYGSYCVNVYDSCYDTTIIRCLSITPPPIVSDVAVNISNKTCSSFSATVSSSNLRSPQYCLYNSADSLLSCNTTGIFNSLAYGSYCVKSRNACPDTIVVNCFSVSPPLPAVASLVTIKNKTCTTFSANISGQQNLTNPQYCIIDTNNVQLSCNSTGFFNNLTYGSYCIKIMDGCYDTTITRCFTEAPSKTKITVSAKKSCNYGFALFAITIKSGILPVTVQMYDSTGNMIYTNTYNRSNFNIDSIPGNGPNNIYKVVVTDKCGNIDSVSVLAVPSIFTHQPSVVAKCPSASWTNGSGNIKITSSSNLASVTVRIIKKDGVALSPVLSPNTVVANLYTFNDVGPGNYIIQYKVNDNCNKYLYDTIAVSPYFYPTLDRSSAYQCDVNGFSVGAVVSNGVGPFTFEIIGSTPASPSIMTAPQANPIFAINNGTTYSLVRLRALDACGNASLEDASVLPLANNGITATFNCFLLHSTLSVDTIYNSTYAWYKKENINSTDSTFMGAGYNLYFPNVLPTDTGTYICHIIVNSGCIKRTYVYNLNGSCYQYLPVLLTDFTGNYVNNKIALQWKTSQEQNLVSFVIERKNGDNVFEEIGQVAADGHSSNSRAYQFYDANPNPGRNEYRLKLLNSNGTFTYSNIIVLQKTKAASTGITVYPNPAQDVIFINLGAANTHHYQVKLTNIMSQSMKTIGFAGANNGLLKINRLRDLANGVYILKVLDVNTGEEFTQKLILQ